jgi:HK97 family phage portal protein
VEYAAQSIGWAQATELFGANFFADGINPSGIVEVTAGMGPETLKRLQAEMSKLYKGPRGSRTVFLDAGMKFTKITTNPDESQFIETMQHQVEQICRWFGVPPHKVMHLLRATFSNIEHQSIEVVVDSVTPWVKALEEEADYKLFGANRQGLFTKLDLRGLLRGDNQSRGEFYNVLAGLGWSFNEIRELEDFNGIGPDGDKRYRSVQLMPIDAPEEGAVLPNDPTALSNLFARNRVSTN